MQFEPADLEATVRRLRGHLVATPLIGGVRLRGFAVAGDLRLKPELLQPGGSIWYRAATHFLLRQLGRCRGLILTGPPNRLRAQVLAGEAHRLPTIAFGGELPAPQRAELAEMGCDYEVSDDPEAAAAACQRSRGFTRLPLATDPDCLLGLATLGLELARELPGDCATVLVPLATGAAIGQGLRAGGHQAEVREVPPNSLPAALASLGAAFTAGHRLCCDAEGLAILAAALPLPGGPHCAVLGS